MSLIVLELTLVFLIYSGPLDTFSVLFSIKVLTLVDNSLLLLLYSFSFFFTIGPATRVFSEIVKVGPLTVELAPFESPLVDPSKTVYKLSHCVEVISVSEPLENALGLLPH